jgi:regulator of PEP synthase PpsR (kinase-PPPase family)
LFRMHRIPTIDSSASSVEEMSTVILQRLKRRR